MMMNLACLALAIFFGMFGVVLLLYPEKFKAMAGGIIIYRTLGVVMLFSSAMMAYFGIMVPPEMWN